MEGEEIQPTACRQYPGFWQRYTRRSSAVLGSFLKEKKERRNPKTKMNKKNALAMLGFQTKKLIIPHETFFFLNKNKKERERNCRPRQRQPFLKRNFTVCYTTLTETLMLWCWFEPCSKVVALWCSSFLVLYLYVWLGWTISFDNITHTHKHTH